MKMRWITLSFAWVICTTPLAWAACIVDSRGVCITGLSTIQDNLLGPLIPDGASPWTFGDAGAKGVVNNMAPAALAEAPALGTALAGTVSHTTATQTLTTTANLTGVLASLPTIVVAWDSVDGAGTGRALCGVSSVTSTTITCSENLFQPNFSGVTAYLLPPPDSHGLDFQSWTTENPSTVWNYYDVGIGLYRLYYRTLNATYQTQARQYADITWQWTLDHGYRSVAPRASTMLSQFFRAGEGHPERLPGLYNWIAFQVPRWADPSPSPNIDNREAGYEDWAIALGAKVDTDLTRHNQYCTWLRTYTTSWNSVQAADGSFPENEFLLNPVYVSAPKSFTPPFLYQGAPWREAINVKSLEAAYESLNDTTTAQGCNTPALAATTLTTITNAITWQWNYGRDTTTRGIYYEVNSQSDDQVTVGGGAATVSATATPTRSTAIVGVGTNWQTAGFCDGTHFIGFYASSTVYKIASCTNDTHATLSVAFGLYGEGSNIVASGFGIAPAATTTCHSSATYCGSAASGTNLGDQGLTRTVAGDVAWLYAQTFNATYKTWSDELISAQMGGPTSGLTSASGIGDKVLPCSGPACNGFVADTWAGAPNCGVVGPPCLGGTYLYTNLGKNYGECFGAPGCDNALAWRLWVVTSISGSTISGKIGGNVSIK